MDEEEKANSSQGVTGSRVMTKDSAQPGVTGSRVMTEDSPRRVTRYSVRPPSRFAGKGADFRLWMQCVELYFMEAEVPEDKRGQELASLLDDETISYRESDGFVEFLQRYRLCSCEGVP